MKNPYFISKIDMMNFQSPFGDERCINLRHLAETLDRKVLALVAENPMRVLSCSYWENHDPWFVTRRRLMDNFCLFVLEGSLTLRLDDAEYLLRPGDCFLLGTEVFHAFGLPKGESRVKHFILHTLPGRFSLGNPVDRLKKPCHRFPIGSDERDVLMRMIGETQDSGHIGLRYWELFLNRMLFDLALRGEMVSAADGELNGRFAAALRFLEANFRNPVAVADIADAAGIREVRCRQLFRRYSGLTPSEYLGRLRLRHAARLLLETRLSVKEIAAQSGFSGECYFCYAFRKHLNCTPEQYRMLRF